MIIKVIKKSDNKFIFENYKKNVCMKRELITVRIKQQIWKDLDNFVILPFSIHSALHTGFSGGAKISSLLNTVKQYSYNKILVLLCDGAHLNFLSTEFKCSTTEALKICRTEAKKLADRFKEDFNGCELRYWSDFIFNNKKYNQYKSEINNIYQNDLIFRVP